MLRKLTLLLSVLFCLHLLSAQDCATCPEPSGMYRSIDGTGNNVDNCDWGKANTPFLRFTTNAYGDGISSPGGTGRRSAREVSNLIFAQGQPQANEMNLSSLVFTFLQLIDHDITETPVGSEFFPIMAPPGDLFSPPGFISFNRSDPFPGTGTSAANPRQQYNHITAFLDGSFVYGSDCTRAAWLRANDGSGKLKSSPGPNGLELLPWNTTTGLAGDSVDASLGFGSSLMFVAGDVRANEQPGLTALHTLFMREHNRLCDVIKAAHPDYNGDQIYQRARKQLGAIFQAIVYEEVLPAMGIEFNAYEGYKAMVQPDLMNIFSAAAYRLGHTMVSHEIPLMGGLCGTDSVVALRDGFFNPSLIASKGISPFLRGLAAQPQEEADAKVVDELRNFLFGPPGAGGFDLAALNIQRGREHGLPDFNQVREDFGLLKYSSFADITSDTAMQTALATAYNGNVNDIDPWVGMLVEDHMEGAAFGPTIYIILKQQFSALRDGDRYYYEHDPAFTELDRAQIKATRLVDVIQRNTAITGLQAGVFFAKTCPCLAQDVDAVDPCRAHISRVNLGSIDNSSAHNVAGQGFSDFTSLSTNANPGETLSMRLDLSECRPSVPDTAQVGVWIDFDQSGLFAEFEQVFIQGPTPVDQLDSIFFNFTVSENALMGAARIRVMVVAANEILDPCRDFQVGEVEDYSLNIIACPPVASPTIIGQSTLYAHSSNIPFSVNNTPGSIYHWSMEGGSIASGQGTSSVLVNLTNQGGLLSVIEQVGGCKSEAGEKEVTLIPGVGTVVVNFADFCMEKDVSFSVPVTVENFDQVPSFSFEIGWNPLVLTYLNTSDIHGSLSGLSAQLIGKRLRITWTGGSPVTLTNGALMFNLNFTASGSMGAESELFLAEDNIPITFNRVAPPPLPYNAAFNPGHISVCQKHMLTGSLVDTDGFPITDSVQLMLEPVSLPSDSAAPSNSGDFAFEQMLPLMGYRLTPDAMALPDSGIDIFDMLALQRHLLALEPFPTAYTYVSADLDGGGWVDLFDMVHLQRFILALDSTFQAGNAWRFIATDSALSISPVPSSTNPMQIGDNRWYDSIPGIMLGQDFVGVRLGDITKAQQSAMLRNSGQDLMLDLPHLTVKSGEEVIIPITIEEVEQLAGYQFSLAWDPSVLAYQAVIPGDLPGMGLDKFGLQHSQEGRLSTLWLAPDSYGEDLPAGTVLFELRFQVIGRPGTVSPLNLEVNPTPAVASNGMNEEISVSAQAGQIEVFRESLTAEGWELAVYPNPFRDRTSLEITLPTAEDLNLQVFNAVGQLIYQHEARFEAGSHQLTFEGQGLPAGVYYARLSGGPQVLVKELLLVK